MRLNTVTPNTLTLVSTLHLVNIYYNTPTFDKIEKDAKITVETVVSSVGGTLGLFTGFSILSAIEILYFFGKFLGRRFSRRKINKLCNNLFGSGYTGG